MNPHIKNLLLFILFGVITYLSTKLWGLAPYPSVLNPVLVIITIVLGISTFIFFIKIFNPKSRFISTFLDFIIGL